MRILLVLMLFAFSAMSFASNVNFSNSDITLEQSMDVGSDVALAMDLENYKVIMVAIVEPTVQMKQINKNLSQRVLVHLTKNAERRILLGVNHPLLCHSYRC